MEPARGDPEAYLNSLEPIGWRLGLERMRRLMDALGNPQRGFASVHVVGTNGKSSVARMIAALLAAHGVRAGALVSPHASRWAERTLVDGRAIDPVAFAAAAARVSRAAAALDREAGAEGPVTQFEAATAVGFVALAAAGVRAAAVEAGLGGRLDATNTIPSRVTVLTSVGLDHTEWLGETETEIATEKLAVLREGTTLVAGVLSPDVRELAARVAAERGARLVWAPEDPGPELRLRVAGGFQRRNFALAVAATEALRGPLDPARVAEVAATLTVPGRLERIATDPPTLIDAAHNPDGAAALAEALPAAAPRRPRVACLAVLADKDAEAMARALAPALDRAVCTELPAAALAAQGRPGAASRGAAELAALCRAAGIEAEDEPDLTLALARGRELAAAPPGGTLIVTGSHYALAPARASLVPQRKSLPNR